MGTSRSRSSLAPLAALVLGLSSLTTLGCGLATSLNRINSTMQDAVRSFDRAIAALSVESANWRLEIAQLEQDVTADVQSTIRNEVSNLTQAAVASTGGELRCNAEFMRLGLARSLTRLRNQLVQALGRNVPLLAETPAQPFICTAVPAAVDLSLEPARRNKIDIFGFDLRSKPITASVMSNGRLVPREGSRVDVQAYGKAIAAFRKTRDSLAAAEREKAVTAIEADRFTLFDPATRINTDISNAVSVVSDFRAVLDLTESGFQVLPNAQEVVLSWDNKVQSEIAILTDQQTLTCETVDVPVALDGRPEKFIPPLVRGDAEFDGNGPCIDFLLELSLDPTRTLLQASITMDAYESNECGYWHGSDWEDQTEAQGSRTITLSPALASNEKIIGFNADARQEEHFLAQGHNLITKLYGGTRPARQLDFTGDTGGDEAGIWTGVVVHFRDLVLRVERCEMK